MIGGIPEHGAFEHRIWKLNLNDFFDNMDECGAIPVPADTYEEKVMKATRRYL